jgi:prefoldin subunit 5
MPDVDLNFIANQLQVLQRDVRSLRDDMRVLTAMTLRLEHSMTDISADMHAVHQQIVGMNERVHKLEGLS